MTEGGGSVTYLPGRYARTKIGSCGRSSQHCAIRVEADDGRACSAGEVGEVLVRPSVTAGYWDDPELTKEAFRDGWYASGDMGYVDDDGFLYISGRKKDMIISGGMNIFPAEVEDALYEHPAVSEAAVVGAPHPKWGEQVVALVLLEDGADVSEAELIEHCRRELARFKVPRSVVFGPLPKTSTGKIQKFELREQARRLSP